MTLINASWYQQSLQNSGLPTGPLVKQRTTAQMIAAMRPREWQKGEQEAHRLKLRRANLFMVTADVTRITHMTDLKNPF